MLGAAAIVCAFPNCLAYYGGGAPSRKAIAAGYAHLAVDPIKVAANQVSEAIVASMAALSHLAQGYAHA